MWARPGTRPLLYGGTVMNYTQALDYIHNTLKFGSRPGLMRIREMLRRLDDPQKQVKFIHVAGTNGKGSTAAMTANVLRQAGFRVGMFISPFVEEFRERIQVDGRYITEDELIFHLEKLLPVIEKVKSIGFTHPLEFEIITTLAFDFFAAQKCDYVVLEVGLGGKFDCTNVIETPEAAVIASISFDHTKVLGNSLAQIAAEKSGIIKSGGEAVSYIKQPPEALEVIKARCEEVGAKLHIPSADKLTIVSQTFAGTDIRYDGLSVHIPFLGMHQVWNTLGVIETLRILQKKGANITDADIIAGIAETRFPGRQEVVHTSPICIVDGGHNPDGIRALCETIDALRDGRRLITVMAMFADKDYKKCIGPVASRSDVFIASQCDYHRALPAHALAEEAKEYCDRVFWNESIQAAVQVACRLAQKNDMILACGSLYTVQDAKNTFWSELPQP